MMKIKTGTLTGVTSTAVAVNVGFKPDLVWLLNTTDLGTMIWTNTMADDYGYLSVGSTGNETFVSGGITPTALGFSLGTDTEINGTSDAILYIAIRED